MQSNRLISIAGLLGAIGVITGAFGAHFLKSRLDTSDLETIKTGVLYLFIHVLALLFVATLNHFSRFNRWLRFAGVAFITGVLLFSGSLILIGTSSLTDFPVSYIGVLTPIGGLFFIAGWISLAIFGFQRPNK